MGTKVYVIKDVEFIGGKRAFPTMSAAKQARSSTENPKQKVETVELAQIGKRELLCAMFNREGYEA